MLNLYNKNIVKHNFSAAAKSYTNYALIQQKSAYKLVDLIKTELKDNKKILDLGSGTGFIAHQILLHNKNCEIFQLDISQEMLDNSIYKKNLILGDIENISFPSNSFDIIISSFALQWINDFETVFQRCFEILKSGGVLAICFPGHESLHELKTASVASGCNFNFNNLPKIEKLKSLAINSDFNLLNIEQEIIKQEFLSGYDALKAVKKTGANYSTKSKNITKSNLKIFNDFCFDKFVVKPNKIAISWEINHLILSKK